MSKSPVAKKNRKLIPAEGKTVMGVCYDMKGSDGPEEVLGEHWGKKKKLKWSILNTRMSPGGKSGKSTYIMQ